MRSASVAPVAPLVEHFFRHEAGRLVAVLTRVFGWRHFDLVEETVQATLVHALVAWRARGVPDNPSGWIHRVARNRILDALRRLKTEQRAGQAWAAGRPDGAAGDLADLFLDTGIEDSQLRMIFACCHPLLAREDQIALTLKTLGGFGVAEVARALLVGEETVKKRLQRARRVLVEQGVTLDPPAAGELVDRLDAVHQVLYLIFNEGYSSSLGEEAIRTDLCEESARLCHLLCNHPNTRTPATLALMALFLFHAARFDARLDAQGAVLLMEEQDRSKWDHGLIARANAFLAESATGTRVSPYHLEAGIALYHCGAPSFAQTNWRAIVALYDTLLQMHRSPVYRLNRAIALAQVEGPEAGIRALEEAAGAAELERYHLLDAALGELHRRAGRLEEARRYLDAARRKTRSPSDRELIDRRLAQCGS